MFRMNLYFKIPAWIKGLGNEKENLTYTHLYFDRETEFTQEEFESTAYTMRKAFAENCNPPISIDEVLLISKEEYEDNIDKEKPEINIKTDKQKTVVTNPDKNKVIYLEGAI